MAIERPRLRQVEPQEAIGHALWEAHACIGRWAMCACLAMLRKAIDVWSAVYRDRHGMTFDRAAGEIDNVYWRLRKIAAENALYGDTIHQVIDGLRLDANDAVHNASVCSGGQPGQWDAAMLELARRPYEQLHALVVNLVRATMPEVRIVYSDRTRWEQNSPPPA